MKRPAFKTLDAAKAHILKLEASIAKKSAFDPNPIVDGETEEPATLDEAKKVIADLRVEIVALKARVTQLEKQLQEARKVPPKVDSDDDASDEDDPDRKDTFSKAGVTEASLAATISAGGDYRKVWAAQRALDAMQNARVNAAVYSKGHK